MRPYAALGAALVLVAAAARPWSMGFPLNDDWAYILTAKRLAEQGVLRLADWGSGTQVLHLGIGALWIKLFGGSFGSLKLLTLAWAAAGVVFLIRLIEEEGAGEGAALAAALVLALNPIAVVSSLSFMTDIPYMALATAAAWAFARAWREEPKSPSTIRRLASASTLSAASYLVRQVGLFLPLGATLAWWTRRRPTLKELAAIWLPTAAAAAGHAYWFRYRHGPTWASENYVAAATISHLADLGRFAEDAGLRAVAIVELLGLSLSPFLLQLALGKTRLLAGRDAKASAGGLALAVVFALGALAVASQRGWMPYLENTLEPRGLGTLTLPGDEFKTAGPLGWAYFWPIVTAASAAFGAMFLAVLPSAIGESPSGPLFAWLGGLQFAASLLGAKFFDRYLLLLLPSALAILAPALPRWGAPARRAAAACLAAIALFSLAGEADYAQWNRAKWRLGAAEVKRGRGPESIEGGLDWDGWWTYEPAMEKLKALKPLKLIGEWEWKSVDARDEMLTFRPDAPEPLVLLDSTTYFSPLSMSEGRIYLHGRKRGG